MSVVDLLKRVSVFSGLSQKQLKSVERLTQRRAVAKGEHLIHVGERARRVFVVLTGKFVVLSKGRPIAEILPGEPIGELAFFSGGLRTSDVVAARDSNVLQLDRQAYEKLSRQIPELGDQILAVVSRRMAELTAKSVPLPPRGAKTVALVPAGDDVLPVGFVEALKDAVAENSACLVVQSDDEWSRNDDWLRRCEDRYEWIFLVCGETKTSEEKDWLAYATRNCDSVCLILDVDSRSASTALAPHEAAIFNCADTCPVHVVLWSKMAADRPRDSARWLAARPSVLRHHVCRERPETIARWLRFLNGTALGVVLCGGGALGTAHLGAVKALLEHGYDIDILGGTSVGAAMAAALASQMSPDDVMENCIDIFVHSKAMSKLSVPVYGLLDHHVFDDQMKKHYGDWDIEDLPLNYFAVSTSLTTNDMHIHRTGPLWETVRASGSIPAIFPPMIREDGEVLIDGALVDNLPVDVMRQIKAGPNVIFNFQEPPGWRVQSSYRELPTRWQTLWQFITRQRKSDFPSIATVLSRTMVVTARRREAALDLGDDILIEMPTLPGMGVLDWAKGRQQYDLAYATINNILQNADPGDTKSMPQRLEVLRKAAAELSGES